MDFDLLHCISTIKRLLSSLMKHAQQNHVAVPLLHPADESRCIDNKKPLSQVTGVVNNPVCDPGDSFEDAAYS